MKTKLIKTCAMSILAALLAFPFAASADMLTFDDLAPTTISTIPDGYGGLSWDQMGYLNSSTYSGGVSGYVGGTVSGDYVAFNQFAQVATVSDGVFNFLGTYLAAAWQNDLQVVVKGFLGATEKYSMTVDLLYSTTKGASAQWFDFNFMGIDSLTFTSIPGTDANPEDGGQGAHFAMDNFTYSVPEPTTLALFGIGLLGMAAARRRRNA